MSRWPTARIGDVCDIVGGGTPSRSNEAFFTGSIPWATVRDMKSEWIESTEFSITEEAVGKSATNILPAGTVVVASRVGLGKVCRVRHATAINQDLRGFLPKKRDIIDEQYLFHWFKSVAHRIVAAGTGATVQGVTLPFLGSLEIAIPPIEEQRHTVAVLDDAFASIATAAANAEKNLANARDLRESLLPEIFEDEHDWPLVEIAKFAHVYDGPHATPKTVNEGPIFLGISALEDGDIKLSKTRHVTPADFTTWTRRVKPQPEDVVFSYETRLGQAAIIPENLECCLGRRMGLLRVKDRQQILPMFLLRSYLSPSFQRFLRKNTVEGATVDRFSIKDFPKFHMRIPPLETQQRVVRACVDAKRQSDSLAELAQRKLFALESLRQSLLHRAFSGQLEREPLAA